MPLASFVPLDSTLIEF
uniref:Uncharacterized protein n=1 Tax=Arundo donax TaxID=35708 RepID=A0A0A8ZG42_ARUDO